MYCDLWSQYIQVRKLFKGGNYSRAETIRGNTVHGSLIIGLNTQQKHSVAQTPVSAFLATWDNLLGEMMRSSSSWWWCCICSTTAKETLNSCTREIYGAKLKFRCCQIACLSGPAWACQDALITTCALAAWREGWTGGGHRRRQYWRWRRTIFSL